MGWATNTIKYRIGSTTVTRNAQKLSSSPSTPLVVASSGPLAALPAHRARLHDVSMAFLGLFSKRDKHKTQDSATDHTTSAASDLDPSEPDYVLPSSSRSPTAPSVYSVLGASSSRISLVVSRNDSNLRSSPTPAYFNLLQTSSTPIRRVCWLQ